ncbi:MAG: 2,3-bisphosphoglycerate-independent phosphoglycerate mutase [Candidatus Pacebacteria bacterium]|nr:2,3-bisphosphoglycerate-independent phosphoglycerate mutase [Candidatus Paceibacterota bacterium]
MQKVILIILDGWGVASPNDGNAPSQANIPNIKYLEENFPATTLHASGINVGLPWWEEGNSEVGHLTIGAGKVIYQYLPRIVNEIQNGYFFQNKAFLEARDHVRRYNSRMHLVGLVSSGAVHSYIDNLYALLEFCQREKIQKVYLHIFTDGRDTKPKEAAKFLQSLKDRMAAQGIGKIATISGRSFSMDRNQDWGRIEKTYNCMIGEGQDYQIAPNPISYLESSYMRDITDEYIEPAMVDSEGNIRDNDAVIFFNFREERAKELTQAFVEENFDKFPRKKIDNLCFVTMTRYLKDEKTKVAYEPPHIENTLGKVISDAGLSQIRISETEKYAHITYFFNGLKKEPYPREDRVLIPSTGGPHYDQNPEMQAQEITERTIKEIEQGIYNFMLINFANPDMVGHTANIPAAIKAAEVIDGAVGKILRAAEGRYITMITADHGNFEEMITRSGETIGEHTSNPVPLFLVDPKFKSEIPQEKMLYKIEKPGGFLFDIAPTILEYLEIPSPPEMIGSALTSSLFE